MKSLKLTKLSVLVSSLLAAGSIMAQTQTVNVGVSVSATGPAASLGIHESVM